MKTQQTKLMGWVKAVLREKFVYENTYIKIGQKFKIITLNFYLK